MKLSVACGDLLRPFYVPYIRPDTSMVDKLRADWRDSRKIYRLAEGRLVDGGIEVFDDYLVIDAMKTIAPEAEIDIVIRDCDLPEAIGIALTVYADKYGAHPICLSDALVEVKSKLGKMATDSKISKWCGGRYSESSVGHLVKLSCLHEGFRNALKGGHINFTAAKALAYKSISDQAALYNKYSERGFVGIGAALKKKGRGALNTSEPRPSGDDISSEPSIKLLSDLLCSPLSATMSGEGKINITAAVSNLDIGSGLMDVISRAGFGSLEAIIHIPINNEKLEGLLSKLSRDEY